MMSVSNRIWVNFITSLSLNYGKLNVFNCELNIFVIRKNKFGLNVMLKTFLANSNGECSNINESFCFNFMTFYIESDTFSAVLASFNEICKHETAMFDFSFRQSHLTSF